MSRLALTDAFFLMSESRRTPMHVGGLSLYTLPDDADPTGYLHELSDLICAEGELRHPFGQVLRTGPLGTLGPLSMATDHTLDMDYHVRHSALPKPGRYRELFALVSRLHGILLDRTRPLWEMHVIEGLQNRQFATYFKIHHSIMDGMSAMHHLYSTTSTDPDERMQVSPFSLASYNAYKARLAASGHLDQSTTKSVGQRISEQIGSSVNVVAALRRHAKAFFDGDSALAVPWHNVPKSPFSTKISGARRFVAQSWPFERVRAVGKAFDGTLNDAVLAICSGALRRYLIALNQLPSLSLKATAPVSVRPAGDVDSANAIGFFIVDLATNVDDPANRMRIIQRSMRAAKEHLSGMSKLEIDLYTMISQTPFLLSTLTGLGSTFPAFSTTISNVPGPREKMYFHGARLDGIYPVSVPVDGAALNITLVSNCDKLDVGITACRRSLPQMQRMIDYMEEALVELEDVGGLAGKAKSKRRAGTNTVAGKRATKKPAPKKSAEQKSAGRKLAEKKSAPKKSAPKKSAPKKSAPKKSAPKKSAEKKSAEKKSAEKAPADKASAGKAPAGNTPARKYPA